MELFFAPMACSLASRMALYEGRIPAAFRRVTLASKEVEGGGDLRDIAPKGQVPALRLNDGTVLTEGSAVLQYIADQAPASGLAPPNGQLARYELQSWISFVSTEIHKLVFWTLFNPGSPKEAKDYVRTLIPARLDYLERRLSGRDFLVGQTFTVADAYLVWALLLMRRIGVDLGAWPSVSAFLERCTTRPAVKRAIDEEAALLAA